MTEQKPEITMQSDRWPYLLLVVGTLLALFASGRWNI